MSETCQSAIHHIALEPITLPCSGICLPNRLIKAAMYEHLCTIGGGPPNEYHFCLYSTWAQYDWAMIITGNVQVSRHHLSLGRDLLVPDTLTDNSLSPFIKLRASMAGKTAILQINHAGRQSSNIIGGRLPFFRPLAPSAVRVTGQDEGLLSSLFHNVLFQTPRPMSHDDLDQAVEDFLRGAELAWKAGFDGCQLHAAHGYLLSQFMSAKTNLRDDKYSWESTENALRFLHRIIIGIRQFVPQTFIVGIKFSTENTSSEEENRALEYIQTISNWGLIDFIEISGGDYTNPEFMTYVPQVTTRQALFARFSEKVSKLLSANSSQMGAPVPLVMLTGGLRSPALCHSALVHNQASLLGIGRGSILCPELPSVYKQRRQSHEVDTAPFGEEPPSESYSWIANLAPLPRIRLVGAGSGMAWYVVMLRGISQAQSGQRPWRPGYGVAAILHMWLWLDAPELQTVRLKFWIFAVLVLSASIIKQCLPN